MRNPWKLWVAIVILTVLLGFIFWVQFGYESTVIIYVEGEEVAEQARAPEVAPAEKPATAPAPEIPPWLMSVWWSAIVIAVGLAAYIIYQELVYRRRHR